jgi:hypothetical protein
MGTANCGPFSFVVIDQAWGYWRLSSGHLRHQYAIDPEAFLSFEESFLNETWQRAGFSVVSVVKGADFFFAASFCSYRNQIFVIFSNSGSQVFVKKNGLEPFKSEVISPF